MAKLFHFLITFVLILHFCDSQSVSKSEPDTKSGSRSTWIKKAYHHELGHLAKFGKSVASSRIISGPVGWLKNTYFEQVYGFRIKEFERCLTTNSFDPTKFVIHDMEDEIYKELNQPWNLRKDPSLPLAFLLPTTTQDVASAVKCGLDCQVHMIPNSGGQSYESISWGSNDTIVLDFQNMKDITIGDDTTTVTIQPGALVGHINSYLWQNGGLGVSMTNNLMVGLGGDAIGGGHGYFSSLYGLSVDSILELEFVDSFGQIHIANPSMNVDLWWGLRGMGPGYIGIVTNMKMKTFKASTLKLTFVKIRYPLKKFVTAWEALQAFHSWAEINDPSISREVYITNNPYNKAMPFLLKGMTIHLLHIQDPLSQPNSNKEFLKQVSSTFQSELEIKISNPNYFQFVTTTGYVPIVYPVEIGEKPSMEFKEDLIKGKIPSDEELYDFMSILNKRITHKRYFKAKSFFIKRQLTVEEMEVINPILNKMPLNIIIRVSTEMGDVQNHTKSENCYIHRNSIFDLSIQYDGSVLAENIKIGMNWLQMFWNKIQFLDAEETYQNYPDLDVTDHFSRNYKSNLGKLMDAKRKWDPTEYFKTVFSIPVFVH